MMTRLASRIGYQFKQPELLTTGLDPPLGES